MTTTHVYKTRFIFWEFKYHDVVKTEVLTKVPFLTHGSYLAKHNKKRSVFLCDYLSLLCIALVNHTSLLYILMILKNYVRYYFFIKTRLDLTICKYSMDIILKQNCNADSGHDQRVKQFFRIQTVNLTSVYLQSLQQDCVTTLQD